MADVSELGALNRRFEARLRESVLSLELWEQWLWELDPNEAISADSLLNKMHLLGFLISRHKARFNYEASKITPGIKNIVHRDISIHKLTPRQLRDVVEDLQMHWQMYINDDFEVLMDIVEACFVRFGEINTTRCVLFDDIASEDPLVPGQMTATAIRRFVTVFYMFYRHLHVYDSFFLCDKEAKAQFVDTCMLYSHHVEASLEVHYQHQMHATLPPASRLVYRQDFSGFYHCISQVVYFHYPNYERKPQIALDQLNTGDNALCTLAPLMQIFPELELKYEDDVIVGGKWAWFLVGQRLFLMGCDKEFYYSENIMDMVALYLNYVNEQKALNASAEAVKATEMSIVDQWRANNLKKSAFAK